jgi:predicted nucleotidyltransferase
MYKIIEEKIKRQKEIIQKAKDYIKELGTKLEIIEAYVTGSVARGDFNDESDIDVVIIARNLPKHPLDRMKLLYENTPPLIEPKAYTEQEFSKLLQKGNPIALECNKIGIKIHP